MVSQLNQDQAGKTEFQPSLLRISKVLKTMRLVWSSHHFPGKRGNIQTDPVKVRLWLRLHYHNKLHTFSPLEMINHGLLDPIPLFVKPEGHGPKKQLFKRWRLIWNISQADISIEMFLTKSVNKSMISDIKTENSTRRQKDAGTTTTVSTDLDRRSRCSNL